jgi:hypothetical protein
MPATREAEPSPARRAPRRRPVALGLSLVLHLGLVYALTRAPWMVSAARTPPPPPPSVVWLRDLPPREAAPPAPSEAPAIEPPPEVRPEPIEPPPAERASPPKPKRTARPKPPAEEPAPPAVEPPPQPPAPPRIDWEKERRAAVRDTIDHPRPDYRTFTYDDLPERKPEPLPIEPVPPAKIDNCAIFKNMFQAAFLGMMGICVRDARGDLFANARPPYMDEKPACRETRPDSPGAVASDGRVISTVKCDLVAKDEDAAEIVVDVDELR